MDAPASIPLTAHNGGAMRRKAPTLGRALVGLALLLVTATASWAIVAIGAGLTVRLFMWAAGWR